MRASACSFDDMMRIRTGKPVLAEATSFMQVEYGLEELKSSWKGFVDISDDCGMEFKTRKQVCAEFQDALREYIRFLTQSISNEMGPPFFTDRTRSEYLE